MKFENYCNFKNGFYIEAGAHDGQYESNTIVLEKKLNWSGILIEPNKDMFNKCMINRSFEKNIFINCALVSSDYSEKNVCGSFIDDGNCTQTGQITSHISEYFDNHKLSEIEIIKNTRSITCVEANSLQKILNLYDIKNIDLLSLDVEGYEQEALRGIDFNKNAPIFMIIETGNNRLREKNINEYLEQFNYEMLYREENDTFYRLKHNE